MDQNDPTDADGGLDAAASDGDASARGILQCLRMLFDEAATLRLPLTLEALRRALETCHAESAPLQADFADVTTRPPAGHSVH